MARKNALGRGLSALIEDAGNVSPEELKAAIIEIPIDMIEANPYQPRKNFNEESLGELADSIRELGIIQPLTVRKNEDKFQLITGERRFRAAYIAGLDSIPAYVREANDQNLLEMALVENIQREDLDSIEVAISYQRLIEECNLTQENLSERVGKKRSTISNYLRLLRLPAEIQLGIRSKKLTMGHARALIGLEDPQLQLRAYHEILNKELSVRKTEELVRKMAREQESGPDPKTVKHKMPEEYRELQHQLASYFESDVQFFRNNKGRGRIVIPFVNDEDLERIVAILDRSKNPS